MILLIDAGNTRVKWALVENGAALGTWFAHGAVSHADLPQLELHLHDAVAEHGVDRIIIANVAGNALRVQLEYVLQRTFPAMLLPEQTISWFASVAELAGLHNGYRNPAQLGCDRFAAAIAGHVLARGRAVIVANCGTATTIDAVTADGRFLGGMILPGLGLMASSLARNTAQLPQIAQDGKLPDGFADNTDDAILSGCLAAQSGAIEHAFQRHQAVECILSGGAAQFIAPMLTVPYRTVDNIVLIGLHAASGSAA